MSVIEDESFMLACAKMAKTYIRIVSEELRLYATKPGHKPIDANFDVLRKEIDERILFHNNQMELARTLPSKKAGIKLKQRVVGPILSANKAGRKNIGLKRRAV